MPNEPVDKRTKPSALSWDEFESFADTPTDVEYKKGERFYRFASTPEQACGSSVISEKEFNSLVDEAKKRNCGIGDVARERYQVQHNWNPEMKDLAILELKHDVKGYAGPAAVQPTDGSNHQPNANHRFKMRGTGYGEQIVIPEIRDGKGSCVSVTMVNDVNRVHGLPENQPRQDTTAMVNSKARYDQKAEPYAPPGRDTPMSERDELRAKLRAVSDRKRDPERGTEIQEEKARERGKDHSR